MLSTDNNTLVAYEYREGPPINISGVNPAFFHDLSAYLQANNLASILGLQILDDNSPQSMIEVVLQDAGTVMLAASEANYESIYRVTGWYIDPKEGIVEFKGGEGHANTIKGTHQVFIGGKPLRNLDALKTVLRDQGIVKAL